MKKIGIIIVILTISICAAITYCAYRYYTPPQLILPYHTPQHDDTLRIAYFGDSWAFMHKDHNCQIAQLIEDSIHRPAKLHSFGICGLTSKEIYENLFDNSDFKLFFQKRGYEYCFVSAGINDTYKKMSTEYYKKSMEAIIRFFLYNDIHPVILEIPNYNIQKAYNWQKQPRKLLRDFSMALNKIPIDCKQMFRDALKELIIEKEFKDKVSIIRYKSWNKDYQNDLRLLYLEDGMHLNPKGYEKLDSVISQVIITQITK